MQQQQSQDVPAEAVSTVSTAPAGGIVVLDDEMLSHVVGGVTDAGPGNGWY
jgi:hypothetical protein